MKITQEWKPLPGYVDFSTDPYEFNLDEYIAKAVPDSAMLKYPETRRALTRANPLLFAILYLPHHFPSHDGEMHFSQFHLTLYKWAAGTWHQRPNMTNARDAFLAPRGSGKSTTLFCLILMWGACNGFVKFVAGYSDSENTVKMHYDTFRDELTGNALIKADYPKMSLGKHQWENEIEGQDNSGNKVINTAMNLKTYGGFVFMIRSISSNSLGVKVGALRPDLILLDDIERAGGDYSVKQAKKRLESLTGGILPQSQPIGARVILVGTNLMQGSIIDGMIKVARGQEGPTWIKGQYFNVHWFRPFIIRDDGSKQSFWPGMWSTEELTEWQLADPAKFAINFDNQPEADGGAFWEEKDFVYGSIPQHLINFGVLSIDPAVTVTRKSDFTAMAIGFFSRKLNRYEIVFSNQYKITPAELRLKVEMLCNTYPEITSIYIETTQGGDTWKEILKGINVKILTEKPTESKELRAQRALNVYQTLQEDGLPRVVHRAKFPDLQSQMKAFPNGSHDDLVDSVTQLINAIEKRIREDAQRQGRKSPVAGSVNRRR